MRPLGVPDGAGATVRPPREGFVESENHMDTESKSKETFTSSAASAVAYEKWKDEIAKAAEGTLAPVNVDLGYAAKVMLTVATNVAPHRASLEKYGIDAASKMEELALAVVYANALHAWTLNRAIPLDEQSKEVLAHRRVLVAELELLQLRGIINPAAVKLEGTTSYLAIGEDVRAIATAFLAAWDRVAPELGGRIEHVNEALVAADKLLAAVAENDKLRARSEGTALMRQAAWSLALAAYREIERGIAFVRFYEGDAELIVPTLFDKRSRKRKEAEGEEAVGEQVDGAPPAPPAPAPTNGPAPNLPSSPMAPSKSFEQ